MTSNLPSWTELCIKGLGYDLNQKLSICVMNNTPCVLVFSVQIISLCYLSLFTSFIMHTDDVQNHT